MKTNPQTYIARALVTGRHIHTFTRLKPRLVQIRETAQAVNVGLSVLPAGFTLKGGAK